MFKFIYIIREESQVKEGFAKCYEFTYSEKRIFISKVDAKSGFVKSRAIQKLISDIKIHKSLHPKIKKWKRLAEKELQ